MHWQEAHANNQYIYPLTAPWLGGGVNRGYSLWGKLVAEKGNRPLESVGKVRYGSEWDDQNGWILLLWLLIGYWFHRLKTQIYTDYSWMENRLPYSYKQAGSNVGGFLAHRMNEHILRGVLMLIWQRMNWNGVLRYETRNGNDETNMPAWKYMSDNKHLFSFFCTYAGWWGISVVFRAAEQACGWVLCGYFT